MLGFSYAKKQGELRMGQVEDLSRKHHSLEEAIEEENSHPLPDQGKIGQLKREKLRIKDMMEHHISS